MSQEPLLPDLPAGVYRHYKGPLYLAFGYGHDANHQGRTVVQYIGLELDEDHAGPRLAVRTAVSDNPGVDAWWDWVHDDKTKCVHRHNGQTCQQGRVKRRFEYVGPGYEPASKEPS